VKTARFRFYAELNDFLKKELRYKSFDYRFYGLPSVKDAIESLGVPHTEVDLILVNSNPANFSYHLKDGDFVSVYPVFESFDISSLKQCEPLRDLRFVADVHLGKLARYLRILGFDTLYNNKFADEEIIDVSLSEGRVILTRDVGILKYARVTRGYFVKNSDPKLQVKEIIERFDLYESINTFSRCPLCNGLLVEVEKKEVWYKIPPKTRSCCDEYKLCPKCGKLYWKGTHFKMMEQLIKELCGEKK